MKILLHSQALQQSHLDAVKSRLAVVEGALGGVNPTKDEGLFIEYNVRTFNVPGDWAFEPCTIHYDTVKLLTLFETLLLRGLMITLPG